MAPKSLKLEFSKAADYSRINALFDPARKTQIDPDNYVVRRLSSAFHAAVNEGAAALLSDSANQVRVLTAAYRNNESDKPQKPPAHDHTEFGSSLADMPPGFGSAKPVIAALVLREWLWNAPSGEMVAEIKQSNVPSVMTYVKGLGWEKITDQALSDRVYKATDKTVADKDKTPNPPPLAQAQSHWHRCGDQALAMQAKLLLSLMDQGGLLNKRSGQKIDVDFSALDDEGLSRPVIEAIAQGERSRPRLQKLSGMTPG